MRHLGYRVLAAKDAEVGRERIEGVCVEGVREVLRSWDVCGGVLTVRSMVFRDVLV